MAPRKSAARKLAPVPLAPVPTPEATDKERRARLGKRISGFDFGTVAPQAENADALPGSNTSSALDSTPILGWVQTSWDNRTDGQRGNPPKPCEFGEVMSVAVPDHMVEPTADLLRAAAKRLDVGISIRPGQSENGVTRVFFRAQTKVVGRGRPAGSKNKSK